MTLGIPQTTQLTSETQEGHKIKLKGWGREDTFGNRRGYIKINGIVIQRADYRGLYLVTVELDIENNFRIRRQGRFDVYAGTSNARRLQVLLKLNTTLMKIH